ncbi:MAG: hypothetical protein ABIG90_01465 [bacterium]
MARKIKKTSKEDLGTLKKNLENTGKAIGGLFEGLFKGVASILDVVQEMEEKGEEIRGYQKEIKGLTKSGKEFRASAGWRVKTGLNKIKKP